MYFLENFARFFRTPILYLIIVFYAKEGVLKNPAKFTAKFMWTAASGISEDRTCLAGSKLIDALENWL